jgi:hypothetical protein
VCEAETNPSDSIIVCCDDCIVRGGEIWRR